MAAGASYPFEATDQNGVERLAGTLTFTDSGDQPVPGDVAASELAGGAGAVAITNGADADLTWVYGGGARLLDYTTPANPTVVAAGTYAVTVSVVPTTDLTDGGAYIGTLAVGDTGYAKGSSPAATAAALRPRLSLSAVGVLPAGAIVQINVANASGADESFQIDTATITRVA